MSDYYNTTGVPATGSQGSSSAIRDQFTLTDAAFDKCVALTGNGDSVVFVNTAGTAQEAKTAAQARALLDLEVGVDVMAYATPANQRAYLELDTTDTPEFAGLTLGGLSVDMTDASWGAPVTASATLVAAAGINVDCSSGTVVMTLPAPMTVGSIFIIHRMDSTTANTCRIAASTNTITFQDSDIGGDLTLAVGESTRLVATTTTTAEIT